MSLPLEGIRVIDLTRAQMGPYAGVMLADMGAEVIKVEPPEEGEGSRNALFFWYPPGTPSAYILAHNRGKKSLTVDLSTPEGKEIVLKLAAKSDVFMQNYRPGLIEKIGLGYNVVCEVNPKIIYLSANGWGKKGPKAERPLFDLIGVAAGGLTAQTGDPDGPPTPLGAAVGDQTGAMLCAYGIMTALFVRERTGIGQEIEVSQLGSQLALQSWEYAHYLLSGNLPPKSGRGLGLIPGLWMIFKCQNGRWIAIAGVTDERWPGFCRALEIEHLQSDARFADAVTREQNKKEIIAILDEAFLTRSDDEWLRRLEAVDQICGPVNTYADVVVDPQVLANELLVSATHHTGREVRMVGIPVKLSKTPGKVRAGDPAVGQHTEDVLVDLLGYDWDQVNALRERRII